MALELRSYPYLNAAQYARTFAAYTGPGNTEYEEMLLLTKGVVEELGGRQVDVLSVGAGTGNFEQDLQTRCQLNIRHFVGVEPNPEHCRKLELAARTWNVESCKLITGTFGSEGCVIDAEFDVVLMSHVLYHMADLQQTLTKARSYLKPGGKLVICLQHNCHVVREFFRLAGLQGEKYLDYGDHLLTDRELCEVLQRNSVQYSCSTNTSVTDVTSFIEKRNSDCVSFLIQTMFEDLAVGVQEKLYVFVKDRSTYSCDKRWLLPRPNAMIVAYY